MYPTKCSWLLRQNKALQFSTSLPVFDQLIGGFHIGQIIELCGPSGIGKSQVCWHLIKDCLSAGKKCMVISNRNVSRAEIQKLDNPDGLSICYVTSVFELLTTLSAVESMPMSLVVVEGIQCLLQGVLGAANFRGHAILNEVKCGLSAVADRSVVVYTNGIVSIGEGNHGPALGRAWEVAPSVRLMMIRGRDSGTAVWRNRVERAELRIGESGVELKWTE